MHALIANLIGIAAVVCAALMAVPQMMRSIRYGTRGVSSTTFQIFVAADVAWLVYSATHGLWIGALGNISCVVTGGVVLYCFVRDGMRIREATKILGLIILLSALCGWVNLALLALWGGGLSIVLRIPQAKTIFSHDDISDVSVSTWIISGFDNALWAVYGLLHANLLFAVTCGTIAAFSFVLVAGVARRKKAEALYSADQSFPAVQPVGNG